MRVRTAKDTFHEGYKLPAGVLVTVEPEDLLGLVQYRVTWIHGPYGALNEMNEWIPIYLNPEDVEEINEDTPALTVFVVAWQYDGGGGFNWYYDPDDADDAYAAEILNADELTSEGWTAYRFDYSAQTDNPTNEINLELAELCAYADYKYPM